MTEDKNDKLLFVPEHKWSRAYEPFIANPTDVNVSPDDALMALITGQPVLIGCVDYFVDNPL